MQDDDHDYAEDVAYWKSSRTSPDEWLDRAKRVIRKAGGSRIDSATVDKDDTAQSGFMIAFELRGDCFQMKWPALLSKKGDVRAAKVQAATALYHEVKAACVKVKFLGARAAFLSYLVLPDGRTAAEASTPDLLAALPKMITGSVPGSRS